MSLSLESLTKQGAFAGAPVEKEIKWTSGGSENTATVFVRKLSYAAAVSDITSKDAIAGRIASSILGKDGQPVFPTAGHVVGVNEDGSPILVMDEKGKPIQLKDESGNPLFDEDGEPVYQERGPLCRDLTLELLRVIGEVNGFSEKKTKT